MYLSWNLIYENNVKTSDMIRINKVTTEQMPFDLIYEFYKTNVNHPNHIKLKYIIDYKLKLICKHYNQINDYKHYKIIICSNNVFLISFVNQDTIITIINPKPNVTQLRSIINLKPINKCKYHSKENKSK